MQSSRADDVDDLDFNTITLDEVDGKSTGTRARNAHCLCKKRYVDRISAFQEDEFVRQALESGMDLREYARKIEQERQNVQKELEFDCNCCREIDKL